ncbi:low-affinity phosphate transporter [Coemansia javaensis]|uniref:Low-affinity phosphate transporter n=1 Tax=Coemansia javaensis TaxID=2761396 RepID=A0A9W8LEV2_9FUNG|nr:low-affinity phosphate transporter [Coemansia javaensis]
MKFSSALQFNAVPDWAQHYLDYSGLKKKLYIIERDIVAASAQHDEEQRPEESRTLLGSQAQSCAAFVPQLEAELAKVDRFYGRKEAELFARGDALEHEAAGLEAGAAFRRRGSHSFFRRLAAIEGAAGEGAGQQRTPHNARASLDVDATVPDEAPNAYIPHDAGSFTPDADGDAARAAGSGDDAERRDLRVRARHLFILLHDLRSYAQLNYTGFSKITKKFDKVTQSQLRESFMRETVGAAHPFTAGAQNALREHMEGAACAYGAASGLGSLDDALRELKACLREEVVWERNTVWRDMIASERMVHAVGVQAPDLAPPAPGSAGASVADLALKARRPTETQRQLLRLAACSAAFALAWAVPLFSGPEQQRCWAMLVYVSLLWATEALPLHVTALLVPLLTVLLGVMRSPAESHAQLGAADASRAVFSAMFSSVIMLLLGGFSLAAALSKHDIARIMASWLLSKAGSSPRAVLLANMLVATFASMWISNVAAPVLCFSLIRPILRTLPAASSFGPCLIMGIALASNVGGMASPISSPQNIIAISTMHPPPSWLQWFAVSLPVCLACDLAIWLLLLAVYRPQRTTPHIHQARFTPEALTRRQLYVCLVTAVTILLWCFESRLAWLLGDMGIVAIIPLVLLFGFPKVLSKEDFNNFLWTVVVLAMGGIALGRAVDSSGLLHELASRIELLVDGLPLFSVLCVFCALVLVCCTFISHTVGSLIILPIVAEVGARLPEPHSRLLVMGAALMASGAMGLPVSGFPNMNAIMLEDTLGSPYLTTADFFKAGIPASVIAYIIIVSIGYAIMSLLGF